MRQELNKVRCVVHAVVPELWPSKVRLSVRLPNPCFPCFYKKQVIARFNFQLDNWKVMETGVGWGNESIVCVDNEVVLMRLNGDVNLRLKCYTAPRNTEIHLDTTIADLLHQFQSSSHPVTLQISSTTKGIEFSWPLPQLTASTEENTSEISESIGSEEPENPGVSQRYNICSKWLTLGPNSSGRCAILSAHSPPPPTQDDDDDILAREEQPASTNKCVTFGPTSTGRYVVLPVHEQTEDRWRVPGAWTSEDDLDDNTSGEILGRTNTSNVTKADTTMEISVPSSSRISCSTPRPPSFPGSKI